MKLRTHKKRVRRILAEVVRDRKREHGTHDRWSFEASWYRTHGVWTGEGVVYGATVRRLKG